MPVIFRRGAILTVSGDYKPGDMPPSGYLAWYEWAEVQHKAALRQVECGRCGKWRYPQELSDVVDTFTAKDRRGKPVIVTTPVCKSYDAKKQGSQS
jgi:hypothetical protein